MTRKARGVTGQLERRIEKALAPGTFIAYDAGFSFVRGLGAVEAELAKLVSTDPREAAQVYETFLAGCYGKAEEIDDSSGGFGLFVGQLYCGWIRARQEARADPGETAERIVGWMEDDPYGFCYQLEKEAAKAFDRAGLAAFVSAIRERFDAASKLPQGEAPRHHPDRTRRRWGATLRTLYLEQRDAQAYLELAEETGLTAEDCHALATMLVAQQRAEDALSWVERGLEIAERAKRRGMAGYDLGRLRRGLLTMLGRGEEALAAAWAEYQQHPSKYTYGELVKFVPEPERAAWHEKAIEAANGADLHSLIDLLAETGELTRLATLVRRTGDEALEGVSHYVTEPAAKKLEHTDPDVAARLWRAQGMRLVQGRKSKYYDAALANFERARRCFEQAGLAMEWQRLVETVRAEHHRKAGFMAGFEELIAGSGPSRKSSFLERAKARWGHDRRPRGRG